MEVQKITRFTDPDLPEINIRQNIPPIQRGMSGIDLKMASRYDKSLEWLLKYQGQIMQVVRRNTTLGFPATTKKEADHQDIDDAYGVYAGEANLAFHQVDSENIVDRRDLDGDGYPDIPFDPEVAIDENTKILVDDYVCFYIRGLISNNAWDAATAQFRSDVSEDLYLYAKTDLFANDFIRVLTAEGKIKRYMITPKQETGIVSTIFSRYKINAVGE